MIGLEKLFGILQSHTNMKLSTLRNLTSNQYGDIGIQKKEVERLMLLLRDEGSYNNGGSDKVQPKKNKDEWEKVKNHGGWDKVDTKKNNNNAWEEVTKKKVVETKKTKSPPVLHVQEEQEEEEDLVYHLPKEYKEEEEEEEEETEEDEDGLVLTQDMLEDSDVGHCFEALKYRGYLQMHELLFLGKEEWERMGIVDVVEQMTIQGVCRSAIEGLGKKTRNDERKKIDSVAEEKKRKELEKRELQKQLNKIEEEKRLLEAKLRQHEREKEEERRKEEAKKKKLLEKKKKEEEKKKKEEQERKRREEEQKKREEQRKADEKKKEEQQKALMEKRQAVRKEFEALSLNNQIQIIQFSRTILKVVFLFYL